jgi:hypothetical protein
MQKSHHLQTGALSVLHERKFCHLHQNTKMNSLTDTSARSNFCRPSLALKNARP